MIPRHCATGRRAAFPDTMNLLPCRGLAALLTGAALAGAAATALAAEPAASAAATFSGRSSTNSASAAVTP